MRGEIRIKQTKIATGEATVLSLTIEIQTKWTTNVLTVRIKKHTHKSNAKLFLTSNLNQRI